MMSVDFNPIAYQQMPITPMLQPNVHPQGDPIQAQILNLGKGVQPPTPTRNYSLYDENRVNFLVSQREYALPYLQNYLQNSADENGVFEALVVIDKMADNKVSGLYKIYPALSKFNETNSPEIQVMLSGIYRKTLVPDAFGPLCRMLYKQITSPVPSYFDPTEETGGAILEYIRNYGANTIYSQFPPQTPPSPLNFIA